MWAIKLINLPSHVQNRCSINPLCLQWGGKSPLLTVLQQWHCSGVLCRPPGPPSGASAALSFIINNNRPPGLPVLPGSLKFNDPSDTGLCLRLIPGNRADGNGSRVTVGSDRWLLANLCCWQAVNTGQCCRKVRIKVFAWLSKFFQKKKISRWAKTTQTSNKGASSSFAPERLPCSELLKRQQSPSEAVG